MVIKVAYRKVSLASLSYKDAHSLTGCRQTGCVCFGINWGIRLLITPMTQVADALKL